MSCIEQLHETNEAQHYSIWQAGDVAGTQQSSFISIPYATAPASGIIKQY
jgi:hypothetical protein